MACDMKEHSINKKNLFIDGYYMDKEVCNNLIDWFENNPDRHKPGVTGTINNITPEIKDSSDIAVFWPQDTKVHLPIHDYCSHMDDVLKLYCDKWNVLNQCGHFTMHPGFNIQKYNPTQGYHNWHCERADIDVSKRMLVFMTYLNDITEGGETAFLYQKTKIKPEKGLTLLWPSDWTHTHKGIVSYTQTKYIATGWYVFTKYPAGQGMLEWT